MPRARVLIALLSSALAALADDLAGQAQQAKQAILDGRYPEAVVLYRKLAAELPKEPGVQFNLALALHSLGRYGESTKILKSIQAAVRSNPKYWFLLGEGYLRLGEVKEAVAALERAEVLSPSFDVSRELASAYLESGHLAEAESRFRRLADTHAGAAQIWAGLALSETGLGNTEAAAEAKARLTALPDSAEKLQMQARLDGLAGQGGEATRKLRAAEKLNPGDARIQGELARALIGNREFEEAGVILRKLISQGADDAQWQFDYGDSLLGQGKAADAIPHLKRAVDLLPSLLPAQAKLGEALLQTGAAMEAIRHLELAAPLDKDGSIHFQLAAAYRRSGKAELASKAAATWKLLSNKH